MLWTLSCRCGALCGDEVCCGGPIELVGELKLYKADDWLSGLVIFDGSVCMSALLERILYEFSVLTDVAIESAMWVSNSVVEKLGIPQEKQIQLTFEVWPPVHRIWHIHTFCVVPGVARVTGNGFLV